MIISVTESFKVLEEITWNKMRPNKKLYSGQNSPSWCCHLSSIHFTFHHFGRILSSSPKEASFVRATDSTKGYHWLALKLHDYPQASDWSSHASISLFPSRLFYLIFSSSFFFIQLFSLVDLTLVLAFSFSDSTLDFFRGIVPLCSHPHRVDMNMLLTPSILFPQQRTKIQNLLLCRQRSL